MIDAHRAPSAVVWVEGPDAPTFLQGLLTNEVADLAVGQSVPTMLLDARGHVRVMLLAARTGDLAYTLVTDEPLGQRLADLLDEYHFSEDVDILGPEPIDTLTILTATAPQGAELVLTGWIPGTQIATGDVDAIVAANDLTLVPDATFESWRVSAGIPRHGVDISDRTLVHEAGLQHRAVSFDKGCYLGQETVARVEYRGGVNRRLVGLALPHPAAAGAAVRLADREVGTLTSSANHPLHGPIGLAVVRKEAHDGAVVVVADVGEARVTALPFTD